MNITKAIIKSLISLANGNTIPQSQAKGDLFQRLIDERALLPICHGSRVSYKATRKDGFRDYIASMPCNPSIGGPAKGIIVKEIDALGGEMGVNADKTYIQMRLLNASNGPAVQALRCQSDKYRYHDEMLKTIESTNNLTVKEGYVKELVVDEDKT